MILSLVGCIQTQSSYKRRFYRNLLILKQRLNKKNTNLKISLASNLSSLLIFTLARIHTSSVLMLRLIKNPPPSALDHHHLPSRLLLCCLTAVKDNSRSCSFNDFATHRASAIPENIEGGLCFQDNQEKQKVAKL